MKIIIFGAPGSGKGTQAVLLEEYLGLQRISLGDILREEVKKESEVGKKVKNYMERGALVPDELVLQVIEANLSQKGFILDGYPRNLNQAENLKEILKKKGTDIDFLIYLNVDEKTIINRLSQRRICKNCNANYHLENMPPKTDNLCDLCGGSLIQRKDDSPQVIKKRWSVFLEASRKLIDFYRNSGKLIEIDGCAKKDTTFERIKKEISCRIV